MNWNQAEKDGEDSVPVFWTIWKSEMRLLVISDQQKTFIFQVNTFFILNMNNNLKNITKQIVIVKRYMQWVKKKCYV